MSATKYVCFLQRHKTPKNRGEIIAKIFTFSSFSAKAWGVGFEVHLYLRGVLYTEIIISLNVPWFGKGGRQK